MVKSGAKRGRIPKIQEPWKGCVSITQPCHTRNKIVPVWYKLSTNGWEGNKHRFTQLFSEHDIAQR